MVKDRLEGFTFEGGLVGGTCRRSTRQAMHCLDGCGATVAIELVGEHNLRSTSFELEMLAHRAGWDHRKQLCPVHRASGTVEPPK